MILVYHLSINREGLQWEGSCDIGLSPVNQQRGVAMGGVMRYWSITCQSTERGCNGRGHAILVYHLSINREGLQWEGSCDIDLSPVNQQRGVAMGGVM